MKSALEKKLKQDLYLPDDGRGHGLGGESAGDCFRLIYHASLPDFETSPSSLTCEGTTQSDVYEETNRFMLCFNENHLASTALPGSES